jgi:hypothetical protein
MHRVPNASIPQERSRRVNAVIEPEPPVRWAEEAAPHLIEAIGAQCGRERFERDTDTLSGSPRELVRERGDQVQERECIEYERIAPREPLPVDLAAEA